MCKNIIPSFAHRSYPVPVRSIQPDCKNRPCLVWTGQNCVDPQFHSAKKSCSILFRSTCWVLGLSSTHAYHATYLGVRYRVGLNLDFLNKCVPNFLNKIVALKFQPTMVKPFSYFQLPKFRQKYLERDRDFPALVLLGLQVVGYLIPGHLRQPNGA